METTDKSTPQSSHTPEIFNQHWSRIRPQVKNWWNQLTDADLEQVAGQKDRLVRALETRYGYAHERAAQEVDRHLRDFSQTLEAPQRRYPGEAMSNAAQELGSTLTNTASEAGVAAQKLATMAATSVSDTVVRAGKFLPEIPTGLGDFIRRHPLPSLVVGIGLGFLLGRSAAGMRGTTTNEESIDQSAAGYPDALVQCLQCGQMVRQADMVGHSTTCRGSGIASHGGSTS